MLSFLYRERLPDRLYEICQGRVATGATRTNQTIVFRLSVLPLNFLTLFGIQSTRPMSPTRFLSIPSATRPVFSVLSGPCFLFGLLCLLRSQAVRYPASSTVGPDRLIGNFSALRGPPRERERGRERRREERKSRR